MGWSQLDLAERMDTSLTFIGDLENGRKFAGAVNLQKLSDVPGLQPYQLFLPEGEEERVSHSELMAWLYGELKGKILRELEETIIRKYSKR